MSMFCYSKLQNTSAGLIPQGGSPYLNINLT